MTDQRKRTAPSVQDVLNGTGNAGHTRFKSGYKGPKKQPTMAMQATAPMMASRPSVTFRSGGILDYAWIAYCGVLAIAVATAIIAYSVGNKADQKGIYYPNNVFTITGVVKDIFADYRNGGLGSGYLSATSSSTASADPSSSATEDASSEKDNALLGESASAAAPNSTTGATMALDVGSSYGEYTMATSHEEVLAQLDKALAANDAGFVGTKLCYEDPESKSLIGYPQSVVEHFTKYMADNSDKRASFLAEVKDEATYSAKNGSAFLVKLPLLQFTINMGYDGTTISISGFADQKMDSGQSAVVSPLLPCMYEIHAETATGSQTSEVECNMNEGNLKINIGVTN